MGIPKRRHNRKKGVSFLDQTNLEILASILPRFPYNVIKLPIIIKHHLLYMGNLTNKDRYISSAESKNSKATDVSTSFLEHKSSLKKYISRFINHPHDIEDIVHDAFLKTYAAEINAKIQKPKAYLFTTAKNLALKHLAKSSYRLTDYLEDLESSMVFREVPKDLPIRKSRKVGVLNGEVCLLILQSCPSPVRRLKNN